MTRLAKSFGGVVQRDVGAFKQRNNLKLPVDYEQFLVQHNGGLLPPVSCFVPGPNQDVLVAVLFGVNLARDFDLDGWLDEYRDEMLPGFLILGAGAGTMLFILGTDGADAGVYCWDHAHAPEGSSEADGNTFRVADTFTEFLNALTPLG